MKAENDFSQRSPLRQFELVVEKRSIFVNAHYLAEISPYFEYLCFGDFREAREGRAELEDESYDEVIELLRFICPDPEYLLRRDVTEANFAVLTHFSHLMQIPSLHRQLEAFIEGEFSSDDYEVKDTSLVDMIVEAKDAAFSDPVMEILHKKLAKVELERVKELVKKLPGSYAEPILAEVQRLVQSLISECQRMWVDDISSFQHRISVNHTKNPVNCLTA
uniref:BTB domain-containing protein n=1 Tax=Parascaris univalens TaxID=6257 RepID=A0A915BR21_PARUN